MIGMTKLSLFSESLGLTISPSVYLLQGYVQVLVLCWRRGGSQDTLEATPLFYGDSVTAAQVPSCNFSFLFFLF